jgi:hypothetical protein
MQPHPFDRQRKILRTPAAAAYCGLGRSTLAKLRIYGGGPVFVRLQRRIVYRVDDLDAWLAAHRYTRGKLAAAS